MAHVFRHARIITLCLTLFSSCALADGFRCGTKLVMPGDTLGMVKSKCGAPEYEEDVGNVVVDNEYVNLKRLTYNLGAGRFLRILEFRNGLLVTITDGPRS